MKKCLRQASGLAFAIAAFLGSRQVNAQSMTATGVHNCSALPFTVTSVETCFPAPTLGFGGGGCDGQPAADANPLMPFGIGLEAPASLLVAAPLPAAAGSTFFLTPENAASVCVAAPLTTVSPNTIWAMAQVSGPTGERYFATEPGVGLVVELNSSGAVVPPPAGFQSAIATAMTIVAYPTEPCTGGPDGGTLDGGPPSPGCGHLFVGDGVGNIWKVPDTPGVQAAVKFTPFACVAGGLAINPAGTILYATCNGVNLCGDPFSIEGFSIPGAAVVYTQPGFGSNLLGGIAVGTGNLAGCLYVNDPLTGQIYEIVTANNVAQPIAEYTTGSGPIPTWGGTIAVDTQEQSAGNPSLLVVQANTIWRIDPPGGGWFGPPTSSSTPLVFSAAAPAMPPWGLALITATLLGVGLRFLFARPDRRMGGA